MMKQASLIFQGLAGRRVPLLGFFWLAISVVIPRLLLHIGPLSLKRVSPLPQKRSGFSPPRLPNPSAWDLAAMHSTWSSSIDHSREDYDSLAASGVDATALTGLCCFGADVGARLVGLARRVDGLPSSVKSLGFEIWAACEVL